MGSITSGHAHRARIPAGRFFARRTIGVAAASLLCGAFGLGVVAVSGVPSGAATATTLFVDNVNGNATSGCLTAGTGACKTIQEGVTAAEVRSIVTDSS